MNEEQEKAFRNYEAARKGVNGQQVGKKGNAAEIVYGEAYQRLVALGLVRQIRSGYRMPKRFITNG